MAKEKLDLSIWLTPSALAAEMNVPLNTVISWALRGNIDSIQISANRKLVNKNTLRVRHKTKG